MSEQPTVRLHVELDIQHVDNDYDTELTVEAWNALTPEQRSEIRSEAWRIAAQNDNGGIYPITPGATEE